MQSFMKRTYEASRYYAMWRNELSKHSVLLAPQNNIGALYQDRRCKIRQDNDSLHCGVERQQCDGQSGAAQIAVKGFQGTRKNYTKFSNVRDTQLDAA